MHTAFSGQKEVSDALDLIRRSAGDGLRLISNLLDVERVAAGKLTLQIETNDMIEIIQNSVSSFKSHAAKKKLSLEADSENQAAASVKCDRDRISQVISNIVGNAIKFTPSGGVVMLKARVDDSGATVSISDTGSGIPEEMLQKIFGRFLQIGSNNRQGLGLGLYISKMIVEAHGGRIWAESKVGIGSVFHFQIPALACS